MLASVNVRKVNLTPDVNNFAAESKADDLGSDAGFGQQENADICLEHYFTPGDEAEACSLNADENFPPEAMFKVNQERFNVTSSYQPSLEGYT